MNKKKIYKKPHMEVINIEVERIVASSDPTVGFSNGKVENKYDALSRGRRGKYGDLWYDGE